MAAAAAAAALAALHALPAAWGRTMEKSGGWPVGCAVLPQHGCITPAISPLGQGSGQAEEPAWLVKPAGQGAHTPCCVALNKPAGQGSGATAPAGQNEPAGHTLQLACAVEFCHVPAGQGSQASQPAKLKVPALHSAQAAAALLPKKGLAVPAVHWLHTVCPVAAAYVPGPLHTHMERCAAKGQVGGTVAALVRARNAPAECHTRCSPQGAFTGTRLVDGAARAAQHAGPAAPGFVHEGACSKGDDAPQLRPTARQQNKVQGHPGRQPAHSRYLRRTGCS